MKGLQRLPWKITQHPESMMVTSFSGLVGLKGNWLIHFSLYPEVFRVELCGSQFPAATVKVVRLDTLKRKEVYLAQSLRDGLSKEHGTHMVRGQHSCLTPMWVTYYWTCMQVPTERQEGGCSESHFVTARRNSWIVQEPFQFFSGKSH